MTGKRIGYIRVSSFEQNPERQLGGYISDSIRIEFGGRNKSTPQTNFDIFSDVASSLPAVSFPSAKVIVLAPEKTFWEKITLIHSECNRTVLKTDANRISRHWYDIVQLADDQIGADAIKNVKMLKDVVAIKQVFFRSAYSNKVGKIVE
jgi:hypothetical protein